MIEFYKREVKLFLFHLLLNITLFFSISAITYTFYLHKEITEKYLFGSVEHLSSNYIFLASSFSVVFFYQLYKFIKTYRFRQLPFTFQFLNRTNENGTKIYDSYVKCKNGFHMYKNSSHRIDFKHYKDESENIKYFFKAKEVVIKRFQDGTIGIKLGERLPSIIPFEKKNIKENFLYFGQGEEELIYASIDKMKHTLIASETGGGKSNVMAVLMLSFVSALKSGNIEKLVIVDLKGNEVSVFKPLQKIFKDRIVFAHTLDEVQNLLRECETEFQKRKETLDISALSDIYELNEQNNKRVYGNIVFYIDELAQMTLKDDNLFKNDKHYKESYLEVQKYMNRFLSLYRAMGFKMFLSTQSPRSEVITGLMKSNIPNRLMLRVNSKLNASVIMDSAIYEELEPVNPTKFPSGRGILTIEGLNNNQALLIQVPFIQKSEIKAFIESLTHKENR